MNNDVALFPFNEKRLTLTLEVRALTLSSPRTDVSFFSNEFTNEFVSTIGVEFVMKKVILGEGKSIKVRERMQ